MLNLTKAGRHIRAHRRNRAADLALVGLLDSRAVNLAAEFTDPDVFFLATRARAREADLAVGRNGCTRLPEAHVERSHLTVFTLRQMGEYDFVDPILRSTKNPLLIVPDLPPCFPDQNPFAGNRTLVALDDLQFDFRVDRRAIKRGNAAD